MSSADVTITLGRSGQKVVKRSGTVGSGARTDSRTFSGSKRSLEDSFGSKAGGSLSFANKRVRGDDNYPSSGRNSLSGARIRRDDLRLKLMHKRMYQSQRTTKIREKISRARSSEQSERSPLRSIPLSGSGNELQRMDLQRRAEELRQMDSRKDSYTSQTSAGLGLTSVVKASPGISAARYINKTRLVASERWVEASGTQRVAGGDVDHSRLRVSVPMPTSTSLDARKAVTGLPMYSSVLRSSQPEASPFTVSSFLHSLGLGKYAISFQAEEVDMTALKQMGDRDLKELGLPMGPRKKILLALLPRSKRSTA